MELNEYSCSAVNHARHAYSGLFYETLVSISTNSTLTLKFVYTYIKVLKMRVRKNMRHLFPI